ncbi:hypothetical protein AT05_01780 [Schleiferia thermophila str. Yellowstone]|nr:hypothetical protein AT05_01780 [Schleiferia thermophila str. Yellowstone]
MTDFGIYLCQQLKQIGMTKKDWIFTLGLFGLAFISRIIPHYPNFTAVGAIAVAGAMVYKKWEPAFLATFLSLFVSDLIINNFLMKEFFDGFVWITPGAAFIYFPFFLSIILSRVLRQNHSRLVNWLAASVGSSLLFFLISNYGVWLGSQMYPQNFSGLLACYAAAIPFAISQFFGTLVYGGLILWSFSVIERRIPDAV